MVHDYLKKSVEKQTGRASAALVMTLMGGVLVLNSFVAQRIFAQPDDKPGMLNPYAAMLALAGAVLLGAPMVTHAVVHLWRGAPHMDELVALALVAAIAIGKYQEAGVIAFFVLIGNLIETRTALGARASIESLIRLTPTRACRLTPDGSDEEVDVADLRPGDVIRVRPGDNIPADGEVIVGDTTINLANITGESMPAEKRVGDEVFSGTSNLTGAIDVRVTKAGMDTTLGRVQKLIMQAEATRTPMMRIVDRYAGWYTPTALMLAAIVLFFTGEVERSISMLVVACPCALILATPTAMVAGISCAARLGVLVKNVVHLEFARYLTAMVFDKTGTLTTGQLAVTRLMPAPGVEGAALLRAAASAEQLSKHPVARAVLDVAAQARIQLTRPDRFEEVAGLGVAAQLNGDQVLVGRSSWLVDRGADMTTISGKEYEEAEGLSTLYVVQNGRCIGWAGLEDRTRPEARAAIDELRDLGVRVLAMVTGDRWSVARRVGREMGCTDVQAEVLPDQKLALVDQLKARGHRVAVVGDGVNDAPALAAGHLGIAMGAAGSDVAINSASIALMNNDLSRLPFLIRLSRATTRVIRQNLLFGIAYITTLETLAALGYLPAMLAAILHTAASAIVIFNSARLVRFGEHLQTQTVTSPSRRPQRSSPGARPRVGVLSVGQQGRPAFSQEAVR
jgi:Cd2+/Zn2+-exporting ATPase